MAAPSAREIPMTIFGRILVFMNLVFAVATGALIVFVFTTRTSWQAAYDDAKKKAEAAEVAYKAEKASHDNDLKQKESASASDKAEIDRLQKELVNIQAENVARAELGGGNRQDA